MKVLRSLVIAATISLLLVACGDGQTTAPTAEADAAAIPTLTARIAYVTAVSGAVQVEGTAGLREPEAGVRVDDGRLVIVSDRSQVDIQFGETGFARIYGPAQAVVRTVAGQSDRPVMELELQSGEVAVLVADLTGGDVFRVRSRRALYEVRGTRFHVRSSDEDRLTVADGAVAVLPRSLDIPAMLSDLQESDSELREALGGLGGQAPVTLAGQSTGLASAEIDRSERLALQLDEKLREVAQADATNRPSLVQEALAAVRATGGSLGVISTPAPIATQDVMEKLAALNQVRLLPVPKDPQNASLVETEDAGNLVKFTLRTVPQSSQIYLDGDYVGDSVYRGLFLANQSISLRVAKDGFRERRIEIDRARSEILTVQLERLPPSISADSFLKAIVADDLGTVRTYVSEGGAVDVNTDLGLPAVVLATGLAEVLSGRAPDLSYNRDIVRTIVSARADLDVNFVVEGSTFKPLHAAVLAGVAGFDVITLVELLVRNGAGVDEVVVLEGEELTPLAIAVRWALFTGETQEEIIKTLLEGGASLDVAISFNDELLTLREIAGQLLQQGELEDPELIRLLRQAGVA